MRTPRGGPPPAVLDFPATVAAAWLGVGDRLRRRSRWHLQRTSERVISSPPPPPLPPPVHVHRRHGIVFMYIMHILLNRCSGGDGGRRANSDLITLSPRRWPYYALLFRILTSCRKRISLFFEQFLHISPFIRYDDLHPMYTVACTFICGWYILLIYSYSDLQQQLVTYFRILFLFFIIFEVRIIFEKIMINISLDQINTFCI